MEGKHSVWSQAKLLNKASSRIMPSPQLILSIKTRGNKWG